MEQVNQFNLTRSSLLTFASDLDEQALDTQAKYFNNTLRWHIGHILVVAEKLLHAFPQKSQNIPTEYAEFFSSGTKPADWTSEPPALKDLLYELAEQQNRMNEQEELFWKTNIPFEPPFGNFKTYGDILTMLNYHEAEHVGKMKAMKQVLDASEDES